MNWHDFGARNYDASLGRWISIDPLAEKYDPVSPYAGMLNNPILSIDPDGRAAMWIPEVNSETGEISYIAEDGDSAKSLSDQYGIEKSKAEAITGTKGSDKIKEGTKISGKTVAENNDNNSVLKLDMTDGNTTDSDIAYQTLFAIRNENVKDNLSDTPDMQGNLYDYFTTIANKDGLSQGRIFGDGMKSRQNISILGGVKLDVSVSFAFYNGLFSTLPSRDRQVPMGNGKFQRNLDFNYPESKSGRGLKSFSGRIITITNRSGNRNSNILRDYLDGSE